MAKHVKFFIIIVFIITFQSNLFGQEITKKVEPSIVGFKTVHLVNLKSVQDENELREIADDFNKVVAELGYQNIRYNIWKETDGFEGDYKYIFESTWPDRETYDKVHEYEQFNIVWKKSYAKWKKVIVEDVYNKYIPLN